MKKLWMGLLGAIAIIAAAFGLAACNGEEVTVAFEQSEIVMKVGDETIPVVTVTGSKEQAVFTSENPKIVSISGNTLVANAAGKADVTAKVGSASATCSVTVNEDDTIAVITLNYEEAELMKGGKITLEASLSYQAQPVTGAAFEWSENSGGVLSVSADGARAEVTALDFGTAKVTVKTVYRKKTIFAEATIRVKADVSLEITNLDMEEGAYLLNLTNNPDVQTDAVKEFSLQPKVIRNGAEVSGAEVAVRIKSDAAKDIVAVQNKTVTAQKAGETVLELVYEEDGYEYVQELFVVVSVPRVTSEKQVDLEKSVGSVALEISGLGAVETVTVGSVTCEFAQSGAEVTVTGFGGIDFGKCELMIKADNLIFVASAEVVTKAIRSADDWNAVTETIQGNKLNGYYVLANDIDYSGKTMSAFCTPDWGGTDGFAGTFDGRGHIVKGFTASRDGDGFFGLLAATAVVKNVGFTDAVVSETATRTGVVASFIYGTVENVFIKATVKAADCGGLAQFMFAGSVKNCFVYLTGSSDRYALLPFSFDNMTIENCYSVGGAALYRNGGDNPAVAPETDDLKNFETFGEAIAEELDLTAFDSDIWHTASGVPVFCGYEDYVDGSTAIRNNENASVSDGMEILGSAEFVYSLKNAPDGITLTDGVVSITGNEGETFTVVATHAVFPDITVEKTFTVFAVETVELQLTADFDLSTGSCVVTVANIGTVTAAYLGKNSAEVSQNGSAVTLTQSGGTAGTTVAASIQTAEKLYKFRVFYVTKIIHDTEDWAEVLEAAPLNNNIRTFGGYYVLAEDLDYTGKDSPSVCGEGWGAVYGFVGTFDGRGHAIKGLSYGVDTPVGFFGTIGIDGVVKNLAIIESELIPGAAKNGILANMIYGTVENVYISVKNNGSWWTGGMAHYIRAEARISHCVIVIEEGADAEFKSALAPNVQTGVTLLNHVYTVGPQTIGYMDDAHTDFTETETLKNFATEADMKAANVDLSGWDTTIWDVASGVPVFRGISTGITD